MHIVRAHTENNVEWIQLSVEWIFQKRLKAIQVWCYKKEHFFLKRRINLQKKKKEFIYREKYDMWIFNINDRRN